MSLFPTISNSTPYRYPITRSVIQREGIHRFCDFSEQRYKKGPGPLTEFRLQYSAINTADKEILRNFYDAQGGEFGTTWSLLFENTLYPACQFIGPFTATLKGVTTWEVVLAIRTSGTVAGSGGSGVTFPHGPIIAATLHLMSAHIPNPAFTPNFGAMATLQPVGLIFPVPSWFRDTAGYPQRTDSLALDPTTLMDGSLFVLVGLEQDGSTPVIPTLSPPDRMLIYDCWATVTYSDTTTGIWRPSSFAEDISAAGTITAPGNAFDGINSTFCTIAVSQYTNFFNGAFLNLNSFVAS